MPLWLQASLLGLLQGLTEFLPVSSSGHVALAETWLGLPSAGVLLEVWLHVGTLAAWAWAYPRDAGQLLRGVLAWLPGRRGRGDGSEAEARRLVGLVLLGTLPAALVGVAAHRWFAAAYDSPRAVAAGWVGTSLLLLLLGGRTGGQRSLGPREAAVMGLAQTAALWPGVSRSAVTLVAGLGAGLPGTEAARFSFLLSVPAVLGAAALELARGAPSGGVGPGPLALGSGLAALSAAVAIRGVLQLVRSGKLWWFGLYTGAVGLLVLAFPAHNLKG